MRPRLASLALLLLTLCRPSTAAEKILLGINLGDLGCSGCVEEFNKHPAQKLELASVLMAFQALNEQWADDSKQMKTYKKSLDNGVLCALQNINNPAKKDELPNKIKFIMYEKEPALDLNPESKVKENVAAQKMGIMDCGNGGASSEDDYKCFCEEKKSIRYCAALTYKKTKIATGTPKNDCSYKVLGDLDALARKLTKAYDFATLADDKGDVYNIMKDVFDGKEDSIKKITNTSDRAEFFCDALKPGVADKVKQLIHSDAAYLATDLAIGKKVIIDDDITDVEELCKDEEFKNTDHGKCICTEEWGFTFCFYQKLATDFKEKNFLKCDGTKPEWVGEAPPPVPIKPKPKKTDGGNATAVTTVKPNPDSVADSTPFPSLLLAPLSAAASLLLLRH